MRKIYIVFTFILFFTCTKVYAFDFNVESKNIILYNMNDNNVIYEENSNEKVSIASLTKIMTAILAIENCNLNDKITITNKDFVGLYGYAKAGFKVGDKVTYEDLSNPDVTLPADKMSSLQAMFGSMYVADLDTHAMFIAANEKPVDSSDLYSDDYDSLTDLLYYVW